jgi:urease accessory protein
MSLLVASKLIAGGRGLAPALLRRAAAVALDWDTRQKSRFEAVDASGRRIGVFLPRGATVRGGDVLVAEDGSLIVVGALAQRVLVVTARATSRDRTLDLLRAAYHLGNRHVALEVRSDRLVLEPDHVLAGMLVRMGLDVVETTRPFEPEAGAYDAASSAHHHGRDHGHGLDDRHHHDRCDRQGHDGNER